MYKAFEWLEKEMNTLDATPSKKGGATDMDDESKMMQYFMEDGGVKEVNESTVMTFTHLHEFSLVMFHTSKCEPCEKMLPVYESVANKFKKKVGFAAFTGDNAIKKKWGLPKFPSLVWFINGSVMDTVSPQPDEKKLKKWVKDRLTPQFLEFENLEMVTATLEELKRQGGDMTKTGVLVGMGKRHSDTYEAFVFTSERFRGRLVSGWLESADTENIALYRDGTGPIPCAAPNTELFEPCRTGEDASMWLIGQMNKLKA